MLAFELQAAATTFSFMHFTRENGALPYDGVRVLLEDSRGDVWIGTQKGLARYEDGRFTTFDRDQFGVESDHVSALAEDSEGNIWVGTDDGIVIYDLQSGGFRRIAGDLIRSRVYVMKRDSLGRIWIGISGEGLYLQSGTEVRRVDGITIRDVYRIAFGTDGLPFIASYLNDLYKLRGLDSSAPQLIPVADGFFRHDDIEGLISQGDTLFVASKARGLCRVGLTDDVEILLRLPEGHRPTALSGNENMLWLATTEGLIRYNRLTNEIIRLSPEGGDQFSLSDDFIRDVLPSAKGDLWVGTDNSGVDLCKADAGRFRNYYRLSDGRNIASCIVRGFAQTPDSKIWIATQRAGLLELSSDSFLQVKLPGLPSNITAICEDGGILWLGSQQGVIRFNPQTSQTKLYSRFGRQSEGNDNRVVSLFRDSEGGIWLGAANGVMRYDRSADEFLAENALTSLAVEDFKEDASGRIWLATYSKGVCLYDPSSGEILSSYGKLYGRLPIQDMTSSMCVDNAWNIWTIGFSSGLYRYDPAHDNFININRDNLPQLPTDLFLTAIPDDRGCLWISSDAGLVQYYPSNGAVRTYTATDGLLGGAFRKGGMLLDDGTMLFALTDGFVRFDPDLFALPPAPVEPTPKFWRTNGGIALLTLTSALLLALIIVTLVLRVQNARARRIQKEKELEREEQLYREKMGFFSGVIHEIKTPLTLIRTPLQHLLASGTPNAEQRKDLGVIARSADYLNSLVRELLDYIRAEEHGYVLELTNRDLSDSIEFICMNFRDIARSNDIRLTFSRPDSPVQTAVDAKAFEKILNNLVDNAIRYASSWVRISLYQNDGLIRIAVSNDGPAIPHERREKIFGAFVTYADNKHSNARSFGIGLPFARHLAELHGGSLALSDRQDFTEFVLTLPLRSVDDVQPETDNDAEVAASSLPLVLVVEDNRDLASFLRSKLKPLYRCLTAPSGERALEIMGRYDIDLLITDIGLKGMSGVELCRHVSKDEKLSHIPIIVLSAITSDDTKIKCMQYGVSAYIEKPFTVDYLLACVKGQLHKRETIKEWSSSDVPQPGHLHLADRDEQFVRALDKLIIDNLSDPEFSKKEMEQALCVSRSTLNRRVTALLGTTPNDYLQRKRLEVAARMLRETPGAMVADVCYAVGFKSPSYFARCFAAAYGMSPTEWKAGN